MHILVGWDDPAQAETIDLILNVDESDEILDDEEEGAAEEGAEEESNGEAAAGPRTAQVTTDPAEFEAAALSGKADMILMALGFPDDEKAYALFEAIRAAHPDTPIIGAWKQGEVHQLAKFLTNGLHSNVARDANGEFIFVLGALIDAAHQAMMARTASELAEKLREEVDSVRRLQESVIPRDLPVPDGYSVVARYEPSQIRVVGNRPVVMAGGDYYDVFSLDDKTLILVLGDASGHGVKACMSIMTMHTLISMIRDQSYPNTVDFVTEVNNRLCASDVVGGDQGGFITLLYCTLDATTHRFQWTSAGHPMPLVQNLETNEITAMASDDLGGLPLAIEEDWEYQLCEASFPPNSRVLLFTDGLDEAFPEGGEEHEQFGIQGIIGTLKATKDLSIEEVMERLFEDSNIATKGSGRHDDTSIVLLERAAVDGK